MKFLALLLIFVNSLICVEIAGIKFPDKMIVGERALILNGAGIRDKFFMDLYVGGLYLKQRSIDFQKIIASDDTMAIKLHIVSSLITSEKMKNAVIEGFEKSTADKVAPIQKEIDRFIAVFKQEIKENDIYDMTFVPGKGVEIYKNNKLYDTIAGLNFKKALFGIWLCGDPAQKSLKNDMLGL